MHRCCWIAPGRRGHTPDDAIVVGLVVVSVSCFVFIGKREVTGVMPVQDGAMTNTHIESVISCVTRQRHFFVGAPSSVVGFRLPACFVVPACDLDALLQ